MSRSGGTPDPLHPLADDLLLHAVTVDFDGSRLIEAAATATAAVWPIDAHECGSRSNPVNGSRIVTLEPSPSVCAAAEIVWIMSSVRLP